MTTYIDSEFNEYMQRELVPVSPIDSSGLTSQFDFQSKYQGLSASQVFGGKFKSQNGHVLFDLDGEMIIITDGSIERIRIGKMSDGTYGLLVRDKDNNILIQLSGNTNLFQSPTTNLQIDFDNERILVKDEGGTPIILLGKQVGGF